MKNASVSMTGFGSAEATIQGSKYRLELRSVNHRFLDLKIRLPRELSAHESRIRSAVQSRITRGAVELKLERSGSDAPATDLPPVRLDLERARQVHAALEKLRSELGIQTPLTVRDITKHGDVFLEDESADSGSPDLQQGIWDQQVLPLLERALLDLQSMREREGSNLASILLAGMDDITGVIGEIARIRASAEPELRKRIGERLRRVLEAFPLDPEPARALLETRLAQELALVLDRTDIREELDRFNGHIAHFRKTLAEGQQLGRKLEFILQELGREINTLGNKAQDLGISQHVVAVKVRLEQLREQVLNLS
jgi:uncharacterized protein (TIGR00255 family)